MKKVYKSKLHLNKVPKSLLLQQELTKESSQGLEGLKHNMAPVESGSTEEGSKETNATESGSKVQK